MLFPSSTSLQTNSIIAYNLTKGPALGVLCEMQKKGVRVYIKNRKEFAIKANTVFFQGKSLGSTDKEVWQNALEDLELQVSECNESFELELLHELILSEESSTGFEFEELLDLYFDQKTLVEVMTLARALDADKCYFKRKKDHYIANSQEDISNYFEQLEILEKKKKEAEKIAEILSCKEPFNTDEQDEFSEFFSHLKDLAYFFDQSDFYSKYRSALVDAGLCTASTLRASLVSRGLFEEGFPFEVHEGRYPLNFSDDFVSYIDSIQSSEIEEKDLKSLPTITVDGVSTLDRDDAISYDRDTEHFFIHIANVAHFVDGDERIEKELRRRMTSLYLTDMYLSMFPEEVAHTKLSLTENQEHSVMTVEFWKEGNDFKSTVYPSKILVDKNLTYTEFEEDKQSKYIKYFDMHHQLYQWRLSNGAVNLVRDDVDIVLGEDELELKKRGMQESNDVIAEFSIFANFSFANFCNKNEIPIVYRTQKGDRDAVEQNPLYEQEIHDFFQYYKLKRAWGKVRSDIVCDKHFSLGVPCYAQMTSPIRRYGDYLNQKQMLNFFRKKDFLSSDDLEAEWMKLQLLQYEKSGIQNKRNQYYFVKYLKQEMDKDKDFKTAGTVLDAFDDGVIFRFDDFSQITKWSIPKDDFKSGQKVHVKIRGVDLYERTSFGDLELVTE
ncbi:MAG: RNB domain-containing ribonuclease [Candidatus Cloacimonetes bacterium]|nr:RNB domain-containing ribonuclease [Candidatus Cloacimonadota bacterium]